MNLDPERTPSASPSSARQQLEASRDEWLRPLIDRIGALEREAGRLQAERDALTAQVAEERQHADQLVEVMQQQRDAAVNERDEAVRERDQLAKQLGDLASRDAAVLREAKERAWLLQEQRDTLASRVQMLEASRRPASVKKPWWKFWERWG